MTAPSFLCLQAAQVWIHGWQATLLTDRVTKFSWSKEYVCGDDAAKPKAH